LHAEPSVGVPVDDSVGVSVGDPDNSLLGPFVGPSVGDLVGDSVGDFVGVSVGDSDDILLGTFVGDAEGQLRHVNKQMSLKNVLGPLASGNLNFFLQAVLILAHFFSTVVNSSQLVAVFPSAS